MNFFKAASQPIRQVQDTVQDLIQSAVHQVTQRPGLFAFMALSCSMEVAKACYLVSCSLNTSDGPLNGMFVSEFINSSYTPADVCRQLDNSDFKRHLLYAGAVQVFPEPEYPCTPQGVFESMCGP